MAYGITKYFIYFFFQIKSFEQKNNRKYFSNVQNKN